MLAYLFEVKEPADSKYPWDYYNLVATIPADEERMDCFASLAMTRMVPLHTLLSFPRRRGSSTPRLLDSITAVSGILDRPHSRAMTAECEFAVSWRIAPPLSPSSC